MSPGKRKPKGAPAASSGQPDTGQSRGGVTAWVATGCSLIYLVSVEVGLGLPDGLANGFHGLADGFFSFLFFLFYLVILDYFSIFTY
jgi:hypothetical protein